MRYIFIFICIIVYSTTYSQECNFKKDTLFLISINATPSNDIPQNICCLTKNINDIKVSTDNWRSFVDTFFTSIVYSRYVFLGFTDKMDCYRDSSGNYRDLSDNFIDNIIGDFLMKQKKMYKKEKYILKKGMLNDSSTITISIVKVAGEFWKLTDIEKGINSITHQIYINLNTYGFDYYYVFKKINDSWQLSKEEIKMLKNKFKEAGIR